MATSAFLFSFMSLLVKTAGQRLPAQEVVLARSVIVLVISTILIRQRQLSFRGNRQGLLVLRGVLGFIALGGFYYAVIHLPLAEATVIQYTNPVFTALLAALTIGELLRLRQVGLTLLSLLGVLLVARPTVLFGGAAAALDPVGVGAAVVGAVFSAAAYVTVRKLGESDDHLLIVFYFALVATIGSIPIAVPTFVMPTPRELLLLLGVGVVTHIAQVYLTKGLKLERAGRATAIGYLQIVLAAIWGLLFFSEVPGLLSVAGAALIIVSTFLIASKHGGLEPASG
jgi:drug/metabolite transporter (DMT)-like permease